MTATCVHVGCDRPQRARTLCEMHYGQLKRAGLPTLMRTAPRQATGLQLDCQLGRNTACVDCGHRPYGGGMRCVPCFQKRVDEKSGTHTSHLPTGVQAYEGGCRCRRCRIAAARFDTARRNREAA
jgi:hypothetical protein